MTTPERRDVLGLATGAAATLLAGCQSDGSGTPTEATTDESATETTTDATVDETGTGDASTETTVDDDSPWTYRDWTPAPGVTSLGNYFLYYVDATAITDADLTADARRRVAQVFVQVPEPVLALDEVAESVSLYQSAAAIRYAVSTAELRERLREAAAEGDPYGGDGTETTADSPPARYERFSTPWGFYWLGGTELLYAEEEDVLRTMVATADGDLDRYDGLGTFGAVFDAVGDVDLFAGRSGSQSFVTDAAAFGYGWTFDDAAELTAPFVFANEDAADVATVERLAEEPGFAEYDDATTTVDGRVVTLSASIALEAFDLLARESSETTTDRSRPPQVTFAFEFDQGKGGEWDGGADERVVVVHEGGDSVDAAATTIRYDGIAVAESATVDATARTGDDWTAGEDVVLRVVAADASFESGKTVTVVWTASDGGRSQVLAKAELP